MIRDYKAKRYLKFPEEKFISRDVSEKVFKLFLDCFCDLQNTKEVKDFIEDFLTPTEMVVG